MNRSARNNEKDNDPKVYGLRKVNFWEKYGVKRFPYRGRRRYSPFAYQSVDGGIVISNDVFGLSIRQFDEMYKACLNRRKTHAQYILNLRYPDKTSNEYLEYLQDSTYYNQEHMSCLMNISQERYLYEQLVNTAGTEKVIRTRQQLFATQDMIQKAIKQKIGLDMTERYANIEKRLGTKLTEISSGSLAEGIDLPGSDMDIMYVIENADVIRDEKSIKHSLQQTTLLMETEHDYPGFTRLRLIARVDEETSLIPYKCFEKTRRGLCLSVKTFVSFIDDISPLHMPFSYGPCCSSGPSLTNKDHSVDFAFCLRSKDLPYNAIPWATRNRLQWPPNSVIDQIVKYGCLLVPIGPRTLPDCNVLWRFSFSVAEKKLVHSFNFTQLLCYCLLKITLRHIVNKDRDAKGLLCSFFLKTALFWVSEEIDIDTFQLSKLYSCFSLCLSKLILWVNVCYCPNYFIPEQNMFLGKISPDNNKTLLDVLDSIQCDGINGLIHMLYQHDNAYHYFCSRLFLRFGKYPLLDLLFYRIYHLNYDLLLDLPQCLHLLEFTEYLSKSKRSTFIVDVCKCNHAEISQYAAQLLPPPTVTIKKYNIHKRYHRHLIDGINTDAVSGWLLYASFYYVTGQFNVTLRLTDYVLSRCTRDMLTIGCQDIPDRHVKYYMNNVHSAMRLNDKMRMAVVSMVKFIQHSSLIPKELQLEVKENTICIPPIVMSHCLRFLCYHHIGDISKRQQSLNDMDLTVERTNLIPLNGLSVSKTILGVCFEISGDKETAYQCYKEALQCTSCICETAEERKSNLSRDLILQLFNIDSTVHVNQDITYRCTH